MNEKVARMAVLQILSNPLTTIIVCLLLGAVAVSGKLSQHAANIMLALAWVIGVSAVMRSGGPAVRVEYETAMVPLGDCDRAVATVKHIFRIVLESAIHCDRHLPV